MPIAVACPSCKNPLRARDDLAGKKVKCPKCGGVIQLPAGPAEAVTLPEVLPAAEAAPDKPCPICGKTILATARKCRFCKTWLDEELAVADDEPGEEEGEERKGRSRYQPCPRCGARKSKRVLWTFWGSFYGPALFTHVRCPKCGHAYNGRTGGSNAVWATLFVVVPLLLIGGIIGVVLMLLRERGYL